MEKNAEIERFKADRCRRMISEISTIDVIKMLQDMAAEHDAEAAKLDKIGDTGLGNDQGAIHGAV